MIDLTEEQTTLLDSARSFARKIAPGLEGSGDLVTRARNLFAAYARAGYHALLIEKKAGGSGLDYLSTGLIYETLSHGMPGTLHGPLTAVHCAEMIGNACRNSLHEQILSAIAKQGLCTGFCLTEASAGSDISAIATLVHKNGTGFTLNGTKSIVINHAIADTFIVFATSSPEKGRAGINAFLVEATLPGVHRGKPLGVESLRGSVMGSVTFQDVRIPGECLLGEEGSAYLLFMETLDKGRPLVASSCVGEASRALDLIVDHVKSRSQFGKTLSSFQGVSFELAEFSTRLAASRLLYQDALMRIDRGLPFTMESSMAKLFACETLCAIAGFGLEILGHRSITEPDEILRIFYDAQLLKSIDGTANVQKMVIASQL